MLDRIERARRRQRRGPRRAASPWLMARGGKATQTLIEAVFLDAFRNPLLEPLEDSAVVDAGRRPTAFTTDGFVVSPLFFPGGCIGDLAVNGTVNDLAVCGRAPGGALRRLHPRGGLRGRPTQRIAASMARRRRRRGRA